MESELQVPAQSVDVVYPIRGPNLPMDHAEALRQALCARLPWLAAEPLAAVHPIKLPAINSSAANLSPRSRLLLRLGRGRLEQVQALDGMALDLSGHSIKLGEGHRRELLLHSTLYAARVAAENEDEVAFMQEIARELSELRVISGQVCGRRQCLRIAGQPLPTFSLMLHGLKPEHSLLLQTRGLGPHRLLGCGVFVPHRSAAAVS